MSAEITVSMPGADSGSDSGTGAPTRASTGLTRPVPLVLDLDQDPSAGIPPELFDLVGSYDLDTPGGCG